MLGCRVGILRIEHTRSTPLDPKLTFWCVSYCLGAFGTGWLPYETRCKTSRTIWENSRLFGCLTNLGTKRAELVQKFVQRSRIRILATNAPDPPHWTLNSRFGAFRTIWVHSGPFGCLTKLGAKWANIVQKFVPRRGVGIFRNERIRPTQLDPKLLFWCVSYYLGAFGNCLVALRNSVQNRPNLCKSSCHEVVSEFFTTNASETPHRP